MDKILKRLSYYMRIWPDARKVLSQEIRVFLKNPRPMKFNWEPVADGPTERVEAARVQQGHLLYVICGYKTLDEVLSSIDVFDMSTGKWSERIAVPKTMAQSHCGVVSELNRYIYFISGQVGGQCSPAVEDCHVFDVKMKTWNTLPPLPAKRYAPVVQMCGGRIHAMGGSKEDRVTPALEHWSLAIKEGKAMETNWRVEPPIPLGGPHRASAAIGNTIYVLGSQHYDRPAIKGDPSYTCDWKAPTEIFFKNCYAYSIETKQWRRIQDMPIAITHTEYSTTVIDGKIVVMGGLTEGEILSDLIQVYDPASDRWNIVGRLPWTNKGLVSGFYDGWLYILTGQKGEHRWSADARSGEVVNSGVRAKFNL